MYFHNKKKVAQRGFHICLLVLLATSNVFLHIPDAFIHPVDKYLLNVYYVIDEIQRYIGKHERQNSALLNFGNRLQVRIFLLLNTYYFPLRAIFKDGFYIAVM